MPIVIQTDPITGETTATEMTSEESLNHYQNWLSNRPHGYFWCSVCEKVQFLRPSQDATTCVQYCCSCLKWVGSVLIKDEKSNITEKEKETARVVTTQLNVPTALYGMNELYDYSC